MMYGGNTPLFSQDALGDAGDDSSDGEDFLKNL